MRYRIAVHQSEEGFSVSVPGLPGCWSQGATDVEAVENIKDAIREYLAVVEEQLRGEEIREIEVAVRSCQRFLASIASMRFALCKRQDLSLLVRESISSCQTARAS